MDSSGGNSTGNERRRRLPESLNKTDLSALSPEEVHNFECQVCAISTIATRNGSIECEHCPSGRYQSRDLASYKNSAQGHDAVEDCEECPRGQITEPVALRDVSIVNRATTSTLLSSARPACQAAKAMGKKKYVKNVR